MNPFPTAIGFGADEIVTRGTDKSVPYNVRQKIQQRTYVTRGNHGFARTLDTGR